MPATATDRLQGLTTSVAVKAPCKAVTTTAITLNGEKTVGGTACVSGDRVLVAIAGGSVSNGIWVVDTGDWARAKDFDGNRDVVKGTFVLVGPGINAQLWSVYGPSDPITIGLSVIDIRPAGGDAATIRLDLASTSDATKGVGLSGFNGTLNYAVGTIGWADLLNAAKPEWWIAAGSSVPASVQAAINYACSARRTVQLSAVYDLGTTALTMPASTDGCLIFGTSRTCGLKYSGTSGAILTATSSRGLALDNFSFYGSSSAVATTGLVLRSATPTVGTFYQSFTRLSFEGTQVGIDCEGTCESVFSDIKMGLNKSGVFAGSDADACPIIGLRIGTTVLANQFRNLTIFARQRCVEQITGALLVEGLKFSGCTFDLAYNTGNNANQACVHWESGQDITFTADCWLTNSQKYGTATGYLDKLIDVQHTKGAINAVLEAFVIGGCVMFGNGIDLVADGSVNQSIRFVGNIVTLYADLNNIEASGASQGFQFNDNLIKVIGTDDGAGKYNISSPVARFSNITHGQIKGNRVLGNQKAFNIVQNGYFVVDSCNDVDVDNNDFPVQDSLPPGSEIVVTGTCSDVVVRGDQQTQGRVYASAIADGTYVAGNTIASVNTRLSKPRLALVEFYIDLATITNPGATDMYFRISGINAASEQYQRVTSTGSQTVRITVMGFVTGTVTLLVQQSLSMVVSSANSTYRHFKVSII